MIQNEAIRQEIIALSANKIDPAIAFLMALGTYQLEYGDLAFEMSAEQQKALAEFNGLDL